MENDIEVHLLGEAHTVAFEELEPVTSSITGKPLRRIAVEMQVPDVLHSNLQEELERSRGSDNVAIEATDGTAWEVESHRSSSHSGGPWRYQANLRQREQLTIERLELEGLRVVPDRYRVENVQGRLAVTSLISCGPEQHAALQDLLARSLDTDGDLYFPVSVIGLFDEPVSMRFGRTLWQQSDSGARYQLTLVGEEGDTEPMETGLFANLNQPEMETLIRKAHGQEQRMDALIDELQRSGVLTIDAITRIAEATEAKPSGRRRLEFQRTEHIEDFPV